MDTTGLLLQLFVTFLMIGAVSFGGGYSMIPIIEREVVHGHQWMTLPAFTDVIAVAGMSPGPIATNSAIFVGYKLAGVPGAFAATLGMVLPSLGIILIVASFFYKVKNSELVKRGFYGLRPIITGLIFYAAISFAIGNGVLPTSVGSFDWHTVSLIAIFAASLVALIKFKAHPVVVILLSGLAGTALYS
ncbi:chromate transporter [Paenibacillus sp.]|uniref:chromate transporter n=1 Tax=Paenibacillus sp. TaxID=58172 RepID=UPI002D6493B6|nr:chromate transporter [Paenibacillus sp.]HZG56787.1 chromate transporter [Paenibacillus sp.]